MRRSNGITAICVVFGLFTIAGLGDSIVIIFGKIELVPSWLGYLTLIFGVTAGVAVAGLWNMKRWRLVALRCWFVACLLLFFAAAFAFYSAIPGGITFVVLLTVVFSGVFFALDKFVSSKSEIGT